MSGMLSFGKVVNELVRFWEQYRPTKDTRDYLEALDQDPKLVAKVFRENAHKAATPPSEKGY